MTPGETAEAIAEGIDVLRMTDCNWSDEHQTPAGLITLPDGRIIMDT